MLDLETEAVCGILTFLRTTLGKGKHISKVVVELLVLRSPIGVAHFILQPGFLHPSCHVPCLCVSLDLQLLITGYTRLAVCSRETKYQTTQS